MPPSVVLLLAIYCLPNGLLRLKHGSSLLRAPTYVHSNQLTDSSRAFSTLVADTQFSTLGVVLLAILARVGRLVGLPEPPPAPELKPKTILATSLKQTGDDRGEVVQRTYKSEEVGEVVSRAMAEKKRENVDVGKIVDREAKDVGDAAISRSERISDADERKWHRSGKEAAETVGTAGVETKKKKRRKKGNAIDDLFAGL